jgi:hypothetical protein
MDLNDAAVDPVRVEQGEWIGEKYGTPIPDMGELCLKVRGVENGDWRRLQMKLIAAVPRNKRPGGQIDPDEADRITSVLLRDAALLDWENLTQGGKVVAYSRDVATGLLTEPEFRRFRAAVLWAAQQVGERRASDTGEQAKN